MKREFKIKMYGLLDHIFDIQVKILFFWITIIRFSDFKNRENAQVQAQKVYNVLTKKYKL